ncbi:MAG: hypothetical protein IJZ74_01045 [Clostridia bacterium]|nr:hypothetical protein [Clostridia bacterium]
MYNMKKSLLAMVMLVVMLFTMLPVSAEELPYDTYNYDYWQDIFRAPAAYVPQGSVLGTDLTWNGESLGAFLEPQDLCVADDGSIYLADTNNHRIVVLDASMTQVLNVINGFDNAGVTDAFNKPTGVAVSEDGLLYIADSMNHRIVVLNADDTLNRIVEIPATAASVKQGTVTYAVGTHLDGMAAPQKVLTAEDGLVYAAVNLTAGSAAAVTDEAGLTYTVVAVEEALTPFQSTVTVNGAAYTVAADGKSVVRKAADGTETTFSAYDPVPNKDIFLMIGRLITGPKSTSLTGVKGVWADADGSIYAAGEKGVTKLTKDGALVRSFASYKDASGAQNALTAVTEFAVADGQLYLRDHANRVIVLNQDGDLERIIASNAVQVTDADGAVTATFTGYEADGRTVSFADVVGVDVIGDKLLIGQADGSVIILNKDGSYVMAIENDTVLTMDAQYAITGTMTTVVNGKTNERFTGLTGVSMLDGQLCVAGANNRVLVLDENGAVTRVAQNNCVNAYDGQGNVTATITGYDTAEGFVTFADLDGVQGVAMNYYSDNAKPASQRVQRQLSIADGSDQLIVYNADLKATRVTVDPDSEVLEDGYLFTPLKVSVDYAGRIYCIAQNMFEGIMVFETNGEFTGFFGTIQVTISAWDKFWRKLATKEERAKQQLFIPTEFTGIDIDEEGFVYASNVDTAGTQAVRRLNPKGEDVIRMGLNANLGGDIAINGTSQYAGPSRIVDVVYRDKGVYSLLDSKRGRIFTYDHEGNLLYIFGGIGTQAGTLNTPVAIEYAGDRLLALDAKQNSILIYGETEYGRLINEAVALRYDGDEAQAVALWEEVLRLDENNELANTGIGKAYLSAGDNEKAMEYLKRGMNREYYSVAFKRYRNEIFKDNIDVVLTGVVVLAAVLVIWFKVIKPRIKTKRERRA